MAKKSKAQSKTGSKSTAKPTHGHTQKLIFSFENLEKLFKIMTSNGMGEIEWENADERIVLKTAGCHNISAGQVLPASTFASTPALSQAASRPGSDVPAPMAAAEISKNQKQIFSPFVGTFYRAPAPDADPYAQEGQLVKKGDPLCIVEAMKLMNEIESEFTGKIVSILVENGQPVEFGEPLFIIETS